MNIDITPYAELCEWAPATWLVVSQNVFDPLIYYSHLVPILLSLPLAAFVFLQEPSKRLNQYFLLTTLLFSLWSFGDLVLWANDQPQVIMFVWSLLILIEPLIYIIAFLFAYAALYKQDPSLKTSVFLALLILPIIVLLPTTFAISSFNLTNCWREVNEGGLVFYGYAVQVIIVFVLLYHTMHYYLTTKETLVDVRRAILASIATLCFLLVFAFGNIVGSLFENWVIGQYGIFGMPIMIGLMAVVILKYKIFNTKIFTAQLLVAILAILTFSILFVQELETVRNVSLVTFGLVLLLGTILIRSVRSEIKSREEIVYMATNLAGANMRLERLDKMKSEFVSIASHQLRSPLTAIRGYTSMLLEGSYGKLPQKAKEALQKINESSRFMALSVEDYLNVSRIESGNMKYNYSEVGIKELATQVVDELRPVAIKRGLVLTLRSKLSGSGIIRVDVGKAKQVLQNLIDNSMKYTPKGSVKVLIRDEPKSKKVFVDIVDTGIGMSEETLQNVFEKFERARNANEVNVTGTGLGLYLARTMARAMKGDVRAASEGEGKGSIFTVEFPAVKA